MSDRLATRVDQFLVGMVPALQKYARKDTTWLDDLAQTKIDEKQPTFRLQRVDWSPMRSDFDVARPRMWPVYRCIVTADFELDDEPAWADEDAFARDMALEASSALSRGIRDVLWRGAITERRFPTTASMLETYIDRFGGRAVLVTADEVKPEFAALVDDVKRVPSRWMPGKGYLRAASGGPLIEFGDSDWQVGWDRVDANNALIVAARTVRVIRARNALRLTR